MTRRRNRRDIHESAVRFGVWVFVIAVVASITFVVIIASAVAATAPGLGG